MLATKTLIAGGYYILAGINENEGVIITRDRTSVVDYTEIVNSAQGFIV